MQPVGCGGVGHWATLPHTPAPSQVKTPGQGPLLQRVPAGANAKPQPPHSPSFCMCASFWQGPSMQLGTPSPSASASETPQSQIPGLVLSGSFGHLSVQSLTPSPSVSGSAQAPQLTIGAPTHMPAEQASGPVQVLPSLQVVPFGLFGFEHTPVAGAQTPGVVALVQRDAEDGIGADADGVVAAVGEGAGVAVVADGVVGQRRVRAQRVAAQVGGAGVAVVAVGVVGALEAAAGRGVDAAVVADDHVTARDRAAEDVAIACAHVAARDQQRGHLHVVAQGDGVGRAADDQPEPGRVQRAGGQEA